MNKKILDLYYDSRCAYQIIGCLLKKHNLLEDIRYDIDHTDFYTDYHKAIFSAIYNLHQEGLEEITPMEIESYLHRVSPRYYKIVFETNEGVKWMVESVKHASLANFDHNYERLKKISYLRDQLKEGNGVSDVLDLTETDNSVIEKQNINFDRMSINDLKKHFEARNIRINSKYGVESHGDYKRAGTDAHLTMERLKQGETFGLLGLSGYKNRLSYGCRRKKFHLISADSGVGKSRHACGEVVHLVATEIWSHEEQKFVINPNNPKGDLAGIYIGTELELDMEVDVIMWAVVSGIETIDIIEMNLNESELERLNYAIKVIENSKIHLYDRPNYDINTLEGIVKKHQLEEDVYVLGIDYIMLTTALVSEARDFSQGMYTREDQLFLYVSKCFKERLANSLNIYVASSTQLNRSANDKNAEKNAGMIRGSYAIQDKTDCASILLEIEQQEIEFVSEILKKQGWGALQPNQVEHVYKNRGGKIPKYRIFRNTNLGNMHVQDLFCTDWDYKLLDIEQVLAEPYVEEEIQEDSKPIF